MYGSPVQRPTHSDIGRHIPNRVCETVYRSMAKSPKLPPLRRLHSTFDRDMAHRITGVTREISRPLQPYSSQIQRAPAAVQGPPEAKISCLHQAGLDLSAREHGARRAA